MLINSACKWALVFRVYEVMSTTGMRDGEERGKKKTKGRKRKGTRPFETDACNSSRPDFSKAENTERLTARNAQAHAHGHPLRGMTAGLDAQCARGLQYGGRSSRASGAGT